MSQSKSSALRDSSAQLNQGRVDFKNFKSLRILEQSPGAAKKLVDKKLPVLLAKNNFSSKKSFVDKFSNKKYETEGFNGKNRLRNFF